MSAVADFDPVAERLLSEGRARKRAVLEGRERRVRWFFAAAFLAIAIPLAVLAPTQRAESPLLLVGLIGAFAIASLIAFEVGSGSTVPTELIFVPMLFLLPVRVVPIAVAAGFVLGRVPDMIRGRFPIERVSVLIGNSWYALGPALLFLAFGEPGPHPLAWGGLLLALLAQFAGDFVTAVAREWFALRVHPRHLVEPLLWIFMIDALLAPVGLAAAVGAQLSRPAALLPLPLLGLIWIFARERKDRLDQALELSTAYRGTAYLLGDVIEADDHYTGTHSHEVVELVLAVCDELRLDPRSRRKAEFAALLHDIGKLKMPSEVINKPAALTAEERELVNTHTLEGEGLLLRVGGFLGEVGTIVRSCHEHYDGTGYPDGLAGEEIPLIARVVACCDAYNAITTTRPYRRARTHEEALTEIRNGRGSQFDPRVADALTDVMSNVAEPFQAALVE
jgi:HD-GYP domain-containing protein (c-di-GMP phosphodiesterase class II)